MKKGWSVILCLLCVIFLSMGLFACDDGNGGGGGGGKVNYTVTFETNGGSAVSAISVEKGKSVNLPDTAKEGYVFEGWFDNADFNGSKIASPYQPSKNITLYAKFSKAENLFTVTFMNGDTVFETQKVAPEEKVTKPESDPIKQPNEQYEYIFEGWYLDEAFTEVFDFEQTTLSSNITLYAKFTETGRKYSVTFMNGDKTFEVQKVDLGSKATAPAEAPTKGSNGEYVYVFEGWYVDKELTEVFDFETSSVDQDIILYAKFTQKPVLNFELNSDGQSYYVKSVNEKKSVSKVVIPQMYEGKPVTAIGASAFSSCNMLTSITIPASITVMGNDAFNYCGRIVETRFLGTIADWCAIDFKRQSSSPLSVTKSAKKLYIDNSLVTQLVIPSTVTNIGNYAFNKLFNLTSVTISDGVTAIGDSAFEGCTALTSITLPASVTTIGINVFNGCTALKSASLSANLKTIGNNAFYKCSSLESITIPENVTAIGSGAFEGCSALTGHMIIPNNVTKIGQSAFEGCVSITNFTIGIKVREISNYVFKGCTGLTSIVLPKYDYFNLQFVMMEIFSGCTSLTDIYCEATSSSGWNTNWSGCKAAVHWGNEWEYVNGVPTLK